MKTLPYLPREIVDIILEYHGGIIHRDKFAPMLKGIVLHYNTHNSSIKSCKCSCKHISRAFCRDINDEILDEEFIHPYELEPWDEDWPWGISINPLSIIISLKDI